MDATFYWSFSRFCRCKVEWASWRQWRFNHLSSRILHGFWVQKFFSGHWTQTQLTSVWRCRAADRSCWVLPCWPSWLSALGCLHSSPARHRSLLLWLQLPQLLLCHCQPWPASLQASASTGTGTWALAPSMARPPVSWCWSSSWRSSLLCWALEVLPGRHESRAPLSFYKAHRSLSCRSFHSNRSGWKS